MVLLRVAGAVGVQAALLGLGVLGVYTSGACRTIYVGDSGELVTAVHTLGIPHPPGYPLYVLLGKLWTVIVPLGSIAYRMSLFSAVCAAAACAGLYTLARRLGLSSTAALFASLLLAFSPSFWGQANVQLVYSLDALFLAGASFAAVRWFQERRAQWLIGALLIAGLGASNRAFMGLFAVVLAVFALVKEPRFLRARRFASACGAAFLVGLLPYLYLPLRSRVDPPLDWGNPETLSSFLHVVLRRDFWGRAWLESPADLIPIAADYLSSMGHELLWVGTVLALAGAYAGRKRGWPVSLFLMVALANFSLLAIHGSRSDLFIWHRYYIPSYIMAAIFAGLGCQLLMERLPRHLHVFVLALPACMLVSGWRDFDRSRYRIAEDFSRTLLSTLPPGAHVAANDDNILFVLIYLQFVEGLRPDVELILEGVGEAELPPLHFEPDGQPMFFTHHPNWHVPQLQVIPVGLVFQTVRTGRPLPRLQIAKTELLGEKDSRVPKDYLTQSLIGHFHYMLGVTYEERDWLRATEEFERATTAAPDNDVLFYNLGLIYRRNGLLGRALAAFKRADAINPRNVASHRPVRAADRIREVRADLERLAVLEKEVSRGSSNRHLGEDDPRFHRALARLLDEQGEKAAARGHLLRALELEATAKGFTD